MANKRGIGICLLAFSTSCLPICTPAAPGACQAAEPAEKAVQHQHQHQHQMNTPSGASDKCEPNVLPGDSLSEALDVNDQGQVVGVSLPSFHAFIYEDGKMFDLNSLIPKSSPLFLIAANGINEKGEITGQACMISDGGCPLGANIPAFLAVPHHQDDGDPSADAASQTTNSEAASITVSEGIRQQMMRKLAFGHFGPEPAISRQATERR